MYTIKLKVRLKIMCAHIYIYISKNYDCIDGNITRIKLHRQKTSAIAVWADLHIRTQLLYILDYTR